MSSSTNMAKMFHRRSGGKTWPQWSQEQLRFFRVNNQNTILQAFSSIDCNYTGVNSVLHAVHEHKLHRYNGSIMNCIEIAQDVRELIEYAACDVLDEATYYPILDYLEEKGDQFSEEMSESIKWLLKYQTRIRRYDFIRGCDGKDMLTWSAYDLVKPNGRMSFFSTFTLDELFHILKEGVKGVNHELCYFVHMRQPEYGFIRSVGDTKVSEWNLHPWQYYTAEELNQGYKLRG